LANSNLATQTIASVALSNNARSMSNPPEYKLRDPPPQKPSYYNSPSVAPQSRDNAPKTSSRLPVSKEAASPQQFTSAHPTNNQQTTGHLSNHNNNLSINYTKPFEDEYTFNRGLPAAGTSTQNNPLIEVILSNGNRVLLTNNEYLAYNLALNEMRRKEKMDESSRERSIKPKPPKRPVLIDKSIQMSVRDNQSHFIERKSTANSGRKVLEPKSVDTQDNQANGKVANKANPFHMDPKNIPASQPTAILKSTPFPTLSQRKVIRPDLVKKFRKAIWGVAALPIFRVYLTSILSHRYISSQDFFLHDMEKILRSFVEQVKSAVHSNVQRVLSWDRYMDFNEIHEDEEQEDRDERYDIVVDTVIDIIEDLVELSNSSSFNDDMTLLLSRLISSRLLHFQWLLLPESLRYRVRIQPHELHQIRNSFKHQQSTLKTTCRRILHHQSPLDAGFAPLPNAGQIC